MQAFESGDRKRKKMRPLTEDQQKLVAEYYQYACSIARDWHRFGVDPFSSDDLCSYVYETLMRCVVLYDSSFGVKFKTYFINSAYKNVAKIRYQYNKDILSRTTEYFEPAFLGVQDASIGEDGTHSDQLDLDTAIDALGLDDRDRQAFDGVRAGMSNVVIGQQLGLTRERIRQIKASIIHRLRKYYGTEQRAEEIPA